MSDLDAGVLAQKLGIGPERVEKALSEMGVPYSALPAEPAESGFYVTADREWLLWLRSDGTGWGRTGNQGRLEQPHKLDGRSPLAHHRLDPRRPDAR